MVAHGETYRPVRADGSRSSTGFLCEPLERRVLLTSLVADFGWTMPDRFWIDTTGNGIDLPNTFAYANPNMQDGHPRFRLNLDASASQAGAVAIDQYNWRIESPLLASPITASANVPSSFRPLVREGVYTITLTTIDFLGGVASVTRNVEVKDYLIVTIGDSFASGEGNPQRNADVSDVEVGWFGDHSLTLHEPAFWADGLTAATTAAHHRAHRTNLAGPAQAARFIETLDPRSSVTFLNFASSGATVRGGLLGSYGGVEPDGTLDPPQIQQVLNTVGNRQIDALFLSIGLNDIRFADVLEDLVKHPVFVDLDEVKSDFDTRLNALITSRYPDLAAELDTLNVRGDRIFFMQPPDPGNDENGNTAEKILEDSNGIGAYIDTDEINWARQNILTPLLNAMSNAASTFGWTFVDTISDDFDRHGYGSSNPWFRRFVESLNVQGNHNGTMHPNVAGHEAIGNRLREAFEAVPDVFADGMTFIPRHGQTTDPSFILVLENRGAAPSGPFKVSFHLSDDSNVSPSDPQVHEITVPSLAIDERRLVTGFIPRAALADPFRTDNAYALGVVVNAGNGIFESNYANNYNRGMFLDKVPFHTETHLPSPVDGASVNATNISIDQSISSRIGDEYIGPYDQDIYRFTATKDRTLDVRTTTELTFFLSNIRLYDSSWTLLASASGGPANPFTPLQPGDGGAFLRHTFDEGGIHYIVISGVANTANDPRQLAGRSAGSVGPYTLTISAPAPGSISGMKFLDADGNGIRDAGEVGLANWTIYLDTNNSGVLDAGDTSTTTDAGGNYAFTNLPAGRYFVREVNQSGWLQTAPADDSYTLVVNPGQHLTDVDFGNLQTRIEGLVFFDQNLNGVRNPNEWSLPGWTVFLDANQNGELDAGELSTVTGSNGRFSLFGVPLGTHRVRVVPQAGWDMVVPVDGLYTVQLTLGQSVAAELNFGMAGRGSISGIKFHDLNGNGVREAGEGGLGGWSIRINPVIDNIVSSNELAINTNAAGEYAFNNLPPGQYRVREILKPGWIQTFPFNVHSVALADGQHATRTFGNVQPTISGTKFFDQNGDGVRDPGEPGLEEWTIYLDRNDNGIFEPELTETFASKTGVPIPDATQLFPFSPVTPGVANSLIAVRDMGEQIAAITLTLDITHASPSDLSVELFSPSGTSALLFSNLASNRGENFTSTTFDDDATISIRFAEPPYTGVFRPVEALAAFLDQNPNGTWRLMVSDSVRNDITGTLNSWSLTLNTPYEQAVTTGSDGRYDFLGLPLDVTHVVRAVPREGWDPTFPAPPRDSYAVMLTQAQPVVSNLDFGSFTFMPPSVVAAEFEHRKAPHTLSFEFSKDVSRDFAAGAIEVLNLTTGSVVAPTGVSYDTRTNVATLTFAGVVPDGIYQATVDAGALGMTEDYLFEFFFLAGDANRDRRVDGEDFLIWQANFGTSTGATFSMGDLNYDGRIDGEDFLIWQASFGKVLEQQADVLVVQSEPSGLGMQKVESTEADQPAADAAARSGRPLATDRPGRPVPFSMIPVRPGGAVDRVLGGDDPDETGLPGRRVGQNVLR